MRSLKAVLIIWTTIGVMTILIAAGVALYVLARASLVRQCDRMLLDRGRLLVAILEHKAGKSNFKLDEVDLPDFGPQEDLAYVQIWATDGTTVYRSSTLGQSNIERIAGEIGSPVHRWVELPNGRAGRAIGITFTPREEVGGKGKSPQKEEKLGLLSETDEGYLVAEDARLVISEFLAGNDSTVADEDGEMSDWIEVRNLGDAAVDLEGWCLTDNADSLKWQFPKVTLDGRGFLLVFASGKDRREPTSELHTSFKLDVDGEYLALIRPDGRTIECAYLPKYPSQTDDVSYGLSADSDRPGYFRQPTPGQPNDGEPTGERPVLISGIVTLVLARDTKSLDETLGYLQVLLLLVGLAAIPTLITVLWLVIRRSLRSLDRLAGQISQLHEHDLSERIDVPGSPQEIKPVVDRLNRLLHQLESAFHRERGFSADVAHELRTPLAGLLMKMDLALSQVRRPDEYQKAVQDCRIIAGQMQMMVENLLSLSRLEGGRMKVNQEPLVVNELIREIWEPLAEIARRRQVEVNWQLGPDLLLITGRTQISVAIRNLLDNAVTYVNEGGHIDIASGTEDGTFSLEVRNSGSLLTEEDTSYVFERFWRGDTVRRDVGSHCGLGLSLTSKIVEVLGGSVAVRSTRGGEFRISVNLPISQG